VEQLPQQLQLQLQLLHPVVVKPVPLEGLQGPQAVPQAVPQAAVHPTLTKNVK